MTPDLVAEIVDLIGTTDRLSLLPTAFVHDETWPILTAKFGSTPDEFPRDLATTLLGIPITIDSGVDQGVIEFRNADGTAETIRLNG